MSDTWAEMAADAQAAASRLMAAEHCRSCVSRAYYSAFAYVTDRLNVETFANDRLGPGHEQVIRLIEHNLPGLKQWQRRDAKQLIRSLYAARLQADYRPDSTVDQREARLAVVQLTLLKQALEVQNG